MLGLWWELGLPGVENAVEVGGRLVHSQQVMTFLRHTCSWYLRG